MNNDPGEYLRCRSEFMKGLSFPYHWSNPNITDRALLLKIVEHGIFTDVLDAAFFYGIDSVELATETAFNGEAPPYMLRYIEAIKKGFLKNGLEN